MIQLRTVQKAIDAKYNNIELVKDDGYFYLIYDLHGTFDGKDIFETESIMVYQLNQLTLEQWMACVDDFATKINQLYDPTFFLESSK